MDRTQLIINIARIRLLIGEAKSEKRWGDILALAAEETELRQEYLRQKNEQRNRIRGYKQL